ncbi:glycosyl hydrolase family 28-related protein [Roseomonas haemaphysalidis]|nr:glycosyl hydrolase family 28-related protein [Roseomonas haemaphysalidis]
MPNAKISELPLASMLAETDIHPLVQGSGALAETRHVTLAGMRGALLADRPVHVRDFGAVGNGTTDDTAAIQAAIDAVAAQGGGVVLLGPRRYLVAAADLVVKNGVFLRGRTASGGWRVNGDFTTVNHALLLDAARTIRVHRNGGLEGLAVLRRGMTVPGNLRQGLDAAAAMAGTAITVGDGSGGSGAANGADATLACLLVLGFDWGIYSDGNARLRVRDVLGDCRNGLYLGRAFDVSRISEVNWHPLVTTGRSWSNSRIAISSVADNGSGQVRVTLASAHSLQTGELVNIAEVRNSGASALHGRWTVTVIDATRIDLQNSLYAPGWTSGGACYIQPNRRLGTAFAVAAADMSSFQNCFEYGHDIGWDIQNDVHACNFANIGTDAWVDAADPTTIGIRIGGTARRNKVIGGFLSSKGVSVQCTTTGAEQNELIGVDVTGGARRIAEVLSGALSFVGCDFTGGPGTGNQVLASIHLGDAAGNLIVTGCDTSPVTFTADSPAAMQRLLLAANRSGTGSTNRLAAGRVEIASVGADAAIATRLSADTDGGVNIHRRASGSGALLRLNNGGDAMAASLSLAGSDLTLSSEAGAMVFESRAGGTAVERFRISASGTATLAGPLLLPGSPTASLQAATKQYVDGQFTERRLATLLLAAATTVTYAAHNARMLIANAGASLSLSWANTGDGFSCVVVNRSGTDLALSLTGFTSNTAPTNVDGFTRIRAGGIASLMIYSPDGGTTKICHLSGAGAP